MEARKSDTHPQEKPQGACGELKAHQYDFNVRKLPEQILFSAIMWHVQDNQAKGPSQHEFIKGRSYLTNPVSYDKITHLEEEGKAMVVVYLDFRKAIFQHCFSQHSPGKSSCSSPGWVHSSPWLMARSWGGEWSSLMARSRVVVNGVTHSWKLITSGVP